MVVQAIRVHPASPTHLLLQLSLACLHLLHGHLQGLHTSLVLADEQAAVTQLTLIFINLLVAVTLWARGE